MNVNGCSSCSNGQEKFEKFTTNGKSYFQYDYRTESGKLFSTIALSVERAREKKNQWLETQKTNSVERAREKKNQWLETQKTNANQITVIHKAFDKYPKIVALVKLPFDMETDEALEYAFKLTNNIEGSWSQGKTVTLKNGETVLNPDYSEDITVTYPLHEDADGNIFGLRSTSVGDQMLYRGQLYSVEGIGFSKVD